MPTLAIERLFKIEQFRNMFACVGLDICRKIAITLIDPRGRGYPILNE
jgi:hypothetical protein